MVFQTTTGHDHVLDEVVVNPVNGWYVVSVMAPGVNQGWKPCVDWCFEQLGSHIMDDWGYLGEGVFEFREEKHAAWFMLRWQ